MEKKEVFTALCFFEDNKGPQNISDLKELFCSVWPFPENGWNFAFTDKRIQLAFHHPEMGLLGILYCDRSRNIEQTISNICDICKNTDVSNRYDDWKWLTPEKKEIRRNAYQNGIKDLVYMLQDSYLDVVELTPEHRDCRVYGVQKDIELLIKEEQKILSREFERN